MLAPDDKNSVLSEVSRNGRKARAYSAYGYSADDASTGSGLGYNGELRDSTTGHYFLGKGYRVFSPVMMRFYSPDSWSPFGEGGVNAYAYVAGDPMMYSDPTGHAPLPLLKLFGVLMQNADGTQPNGLTRVMFNAVDDPLAGWTQHSGAGAGAGMSTTQSARRAATQSPVSATGGRSRNVVSTSENVAQTRVKPRKKVGFNNQTEIYEYKQKMKPEHWTTRADEHRAIEELDFEEGRRAPEPAHSSGNRSQANPDRTARAQAEIRKGSTKKPTVREQAMLRRTQ